MENNILKKYTTWLLRIFLYWAIIFILIIVIDLNSNNKKLDENLRNFINIFNKPVKNENWMIE